MILSLKPLLLFIVIQIIAINISWKKRNKLWVIGANFIFSGIIATVLLASQWPIIIVWTAFSVWIGLMILIADAHYSYSYEH